MKLAAVILNARRRLGRQSGLTLLEILVSSTLLVVIVLGLTAMFAQTQRAFRGGMRQVDVLEGGRAAMEMIARDLEQITAWQVGTNLSLYAGLRRTDPQAVSLESGQTLALQNIFFLSQSTNWNGLGYMVLDPEDRLNKGVLFGTLHRYRTNAARLTDNTFFRGFNSDADRLWTDRQISRILDGVVHFQVHFYDPQGNYWNPIIMSNSNVQVKTDYIPGTYEYTFHGTELPGFLEVELGIIEPPVLERMKAMPPGAQSAFLARQAGRIHFFRQQIPIRNATR
jgi:hypothetical protein